MKTKEDLSSENSRGRRGCRHRHQSESPGHGAKGGPRVSNSWTAEGALGGTLDRRGSAGGDVQGGACHHPLTHTHTHTRAHMFILALTHTHILRPETKLLTCLAGAGPGLHPSDPGSISFLPPLPPSLPQMFTEAPASRPDVCDAPGCLRDPEAKKAAR